MSANPNWNPSLGARNAERHSVERVSGMSNDQNAKCRWAECRIDCVWMREAQNVEIWNAKLVVWEHEKTRPQAGERDITSCVVALGDNVMAFVSTVWLSLFLIQNAQLWNVNIGHYVDYSGENCAEKATEKQIQYTCVVCLVEHRYDTVFCCKCCQWYYCECEELTLHFWAKLDRLWVCIRSATAVQV